MVLGRAGRALAAQNTFGDPELDALAERLGHRFARPALLTQALTHASAIHGDDGGETYERLEFLGDRVLALVVADLLLMEFPDEAEGPLAQRLAELVRRETLTGVSTSS